MPFPKRDTRVNKTVGNTTHKVSQNNKLRPDCRQSPNTNNLNMIMQYDRVGIRNKPFHNQETFFITPYTIYVSDINRSKAINIKIIVTGIFIRRNSFLPIMGKETVKRHNIISLILLSYYLSRSIIS